MFSSRRADIAPGGRTTISPRRWMAHALTVTCALAYSAVEPPGACRAEPPIADAELIDASFRFQPNGDAAFVPVTVNATSRQFMLDTACTLTTYDSSLRRELGDPLRAVWVKTSAGVAEVERFTAPRAAVGGYPMTDVSQVLCADFSQHRAINGVDFYGCVGTDFLRRRIIRIDWDRGEVAFLKFVPPDAGESLPFFISQSGMPTAVMTANRTQNISVAIATGITSNGTISSSLIDRLVDADGAEYVGRSLFRSLNQLHEFRLARVRDVRLGRFKHPEVTFVSGNSNVLGARYLSRYIVTFDFPAKTIYLKPGARFDDPDRYDLSGAHLWRPEGKTAVHVVDDGGAAKAAGLAPADIILEIDSRVCDSLTMRQVRELFCIPGEHVVRIKRGEKTLRIVLMLKEAVESRDQ